MADFIPKEMNFEQSLNRLDTFLESLQRIHVNKDDFVYFHGTKYEIISTQILLFDDFFKIHENKLGHFIY